MSRLFFVAAFFLVVTLTGCQYNWHLSNWSSKNLKNQDIYQDIKQLIQTDEINPVPLPTNIITQSQLPEINFLNAQYSFQSYQCNPLNIITNDSYFKCDLGVHTQALLKHKKLEQTSFQIYRYDISLTDNPDQLIMSQTGVETLTILHWSKYHNDLNHIIWSVTSTGQERIILTIQDMIIEGSYIPANQVVYIKLIDRVPLYHTITSSGIYASKPYQISRPINWSELVPWKIPTQGKILLHSYRRQIPSITQFDQLLGSSSQMQVQQVSSGLLITYSWLQQDRNYHIKWTVESKSFDYLFKTFAPFAVTVSKNISHHPIRLQPNQQDNDRYDNNYHLCFNQPLDSTVIKQVLDHTLWSGNYTMSLSTQNHTYQSRFSSTGESTQDYCMMMYYYLDPSRSHIFDLKGIKSIFGESLDIQIKIPPHQISNQHKYASIIGNKLNILPSHSSLSETIQYNYKNITGVTLDYQTCHMISGQKLITRLQSNLSSDQEQLLDQAIQCDPIKSRLLLFTWFKRWRNTLVDLDIKSIFDDQIPSLFKVWIDKTNKYFIHTDLWLIAKYSPGQLHIRTTDISQGKLLSGVSVEISYLTGSPNATSIDQMSRWYQTGIVNGYATFAIPTLMTNQVWYIKANKWSDQTIILYPDQYVGRSTTGGQYSSYRNDFVIDSYQIGAMHGYGLTSWRLYAYTDRVLYKAGDEIYLAWWIRKPHETTQYTWDLTITISDPDGNILSTQNLTGVDVFGWFKTSYVLPWQTKLWSYRIDYTSQDTSYSSYFSIQQYKKSNYYIQTNPLINSRGDQYLRLQPTYYRWEPLKSYDIKLDYTLKWQHDGIYDRMTNPDQPWYYAKVRGENITLAWNLSLTWQKTSIDIPLTKQVPFISTMDMSMMITDSSNQELVYKTYSQTIYPPYLVGFQGRDYERVSSQDHTYILQGKLLKFDQDRGDVFQNYLPAWEGKIQVLLYYRNFWSSQEQGPDQQRYYADESYVHLSTGFTDVDNGSRSYNIDISKPGKYFVRAIYQSGYEVQKTLVSYGGDIPMYGDSSNNFKLGVFVKDKTYQIGEEMDIQIEPYIKWATAIVTIEQDGKILHQSNRILDGKTLSLKTESDWYPNAFISVIQLVWQDLNTSVSPQRQEPRFFIWYQKIKLDPKSLALKYNLTVTNMQDKALTHYKPGQKIKLNIQVKDTNEKPVQARLSVGLVDKWLIDLYDQIKKPLEWFYIDSIPWFAIISNLKLIYQALKVFSADGSKWWWGANIPQWPLNLNPRSKFFDVAFWRWWVITDTQGKITLEAQLPDNLTTWVWEVIGVWKEGQMGSARSYLTVSKDVILDANLPQFVWYQDQIVVPLSLTVHNDRYTNLVPQWSITLGDQTYPLQITSKGSGRYQTLIDMTQFSTTNLLKHEYLDIFLQAWDQETIIQKIPVRSEWIFNHDHRARYTQALNQTIAISGSAQQGILKLSLGILPIQATSRALDYLVYYPYGCLEQIMSALYPLMLASKLNKANILTTQYLSGDKVILYSQTQSLSGLITDTLNRIDQYRYSDGLYSFWPWDKKNYELSVYVYQVLSVIKSMWYPINSKMLSKLDSILNQQTNPYLRLYYLYNKSLNNKIDTNKINEYLKTKTDPVKAIFAYSIFAYQWVSRDDLIPQIQKFLQSTQTAQIWGTDTPFIDKDILTSIFVKWLIRNNKTELAKPYILDFHRSVDQNGIRWWSTQKNMQILSMMSDYLLSQSGTDKNRIDATILINGVSYPVILDSKKQSTDITIDIPSSSQVTLSVKSPETLLINYALKYIPKDSQVLTDEMHGVSDLSLTYSGMQNAQIWNIVRVIWHFRVLSKAHQVAIIYPIPAQYKIINPKLLGTIQDDLTMWWYEYGEFWEKIDKHQLTFTNIGTDTTRYNCEPTHYEIKFDHLFLYYDQLAESAGCEIGFDMIRTHQGKTKQQALRLWEMYFSNVRWIKR